MAGLIAPLVRGGLSCAELSQGRDLESFCEKMLLRHKAIVEINKLREQLGRQGELPDTQVSHLLSAMPESLCAQASSSTHCLRA